MLEELLLRAYTKKLGPVDRRSGIDLKRKDWIELPIVLEPKFLKPSAPR